jgi:hypothetical protein
MVQASAHMGMSVNMHGWAFLFGHRTIIALHHLPSPHLHPDGHHFHLPLRNPQESQIMLLPDGNNPQGGSLASLWEQGAHFSKAQ